MPHIHRPEVVDTPHNNGDDNSPKDTSRHDIFDYGSYEFIRDVSTSLPARGKAFGVCSSCLARLTAMIEVTEEIKEEGYLTFTGIMARASLRLADNQELRLMHLEFEWLILLVQVNRGLVVMGKDYCRCSCNRRFSN